MLLLMQFARSKPRFLMAPSPTSTSPYSKSGIFAFLKKAVNLCSTTVHSLISSFTKTLSILTHCSVLIHKSNRDKILQLLLTEVMLLRIHTLRNAGIVSYFNVAVDQRAIQLLQVLLMVHYFQCNSEKPSLCLSFNQLH